MGRLLSLLAAAGGQAANLDRLASWRRAVSGSIDDPVFTHTPIVTPSVGGSVPALQPTNVVVNALLLQSYTVNLDAGWRQFKIPLGYVDSASVHIHWSKTGNANEAGKNVRWRVSYVVFNGEDQDAAGSPTVITLDDTYLDSGTTTRIVYETPSVALVGFIPDYYTSMKVDAITPAGTPMASEPGLFALDLVMRQRLVPPT
jgi:hypothetical protein